MDLNPHREKIARALLDLESAMQRLIEDLAHRAITAIVQGEPSDRSATRRVCEAYATIDYAMQDDVNQSPVCLGLIGVSADTAKRAQAVNTAKAEFKSLCAPLQGIRVRIPVKGGAVKTQSLPAIRVILRNIQRSDVNLLAAYRKIPIFKAPPKSVTYTRANTRAVYRKSVEEIAAMLSNLHSPAATADRERIASLDRRISHLALVKERYQNIRANVLYARLDSKGRGRIQISAELPLLYVAGRRLEIPEVRFPADVQDDTRPRRVRESKLQAAPFLQALPVYRYNPA